MHHLRWDARADSIQVTLTPSTLSGTAGSTLTFDATLTNTSTSTIFLNGDSSTTASTGRTVDDNSFLNNTGTSFAAGQSPRTFEIFDVIIAAGVPPVFCSTACTERTELSPGLLRLDDPTPRVDVA